MLAVVGVAEHFRNSQLIHGVRLVDLLIAPHLLFIHLKLELELKEGQLLLKLLFSLVVLHFHGLLTGIAVLLKVVQSQGRRIRNITYVNVRRLASSDATNSVTLGLHRSELGR